ncbi:tetratricopeptide repeat protein [Clostridium felsineum]|uniref:tetratricopeptide repeat protein n=1 Tax=Clostridium felsineum TaxID=36839 RepID=UPI00214DCBD1|nr:tetratricopeptide repeat protein [Clostridium felsineum]MCR3759756.1 tetratricopeptide repeat protein [Clostridium felsineum]
MNSDGLTIRCEKDIDLKLRAVIIEFTRWLRSKYVFPIKVTVFIKNKYKSKSNDKERFFSSFVMPNKERGNPHIRIEVKNDMYDTIELREYVVYSIAYEVMIYMQWIKKLQFCDRDAEKQANKLVELFIEERKDDLTITNKEKKMLELADKKFNNKEFDKAISIYKEMIKNDYYYIEWAYGSIAYCYDCLENYNESLVYYDKALKNNKDSVIYMNKGFALQALEKHKEAIENFDKSIKIKPCKEAYVFKADSQGRIKNFKEAIECCNEALKLDENYDVPYNRKGQFLYEIGELKEAKRMFLKAISLNPDYADAYYNLALAHMKLDDLKLSIKYLNKSIKLDEEYRRYAEEDGIWSINYMK